MIPKDSSPRVRQEVTYSSRAEQVSITSAEHTTDLANVLRHQRSKGGIRSGLGVGGGSGSDGIGNEGDDGKSLGDGGELHFG